MNYTTATYSANEIAKEIIIYSNDHDYPISNLKLQKLLYFIQAVFLNEYNRACYDDTIEAWSFGPVVPNVYHNYKIFGAGNIPKRIFERNSFASIFTDTNSFGTHLSANDKEIIDWIVDSFSSYSATDLVDITHHQDPWLDAYIPRYNNEITKEAILNYFKNLKHK